MSKFHTAIVVEQRPLRRLCWMQLHCPTLASQVRAGHYLLLRCADGSSADPLLRRSLFVAGADGGTGMVRLLFAPNERGLQWLARQQTGAEIDIFGPLGRPFQVEPRTGNLLLVGHGPALAALLPLAVAAIASGSAVVMLASAAEEDLLLPPYLLPPEVEYQTAIGNLRDVLHAGDSADQRLRWTASGPILWADQLCAALPQTQVQPLVDAVRAQRLRWARGFAQVALVDEMPCGTGACLSCSIETRDGWRLRCKDGPVFDLKSIK